MSDKSCLQKFCCQKPECGRYVGDTVFNDESTMDTVINGGGCCIWTFFHNCMPIWLCGKVLEKEFIQEEIYQRKEERIGANIGEGISHCCCICHLLCCCWVIAGICRSCDYID